MPLYMDIHNLPEGTTPEDVAKAHAKDWKRSENMASSTPNTGSTTLGEKFFASPMRQVPNPSTGISAPEGRAKERIMNFRHCNVARLAYLVRHAGFHSAQYAAGRRASNARAPRP